MDNLNINWPNLKYIIVMKFLVFRYPFALFLRFWIRHVSDAPEIKTELVDDFQSGICGIIKFFNRLAVRSHFWDKEHLFFDFCLWEFQRPLDKIITMGRHKTCTENTSRNPTLHFLNLPIRFPIEGILIFAAGSTFLFDGEREWGI